MKKIKNLAERFWNMGLGLRTKLILIFLVVKVIPIILIVVIAWTQITMLGNHVKEIAVNDSSEALNASAVENIERMTTDTANKVADFLYARDDDLLYLASMEPSEETYQEFINKKTGKVIQTGIWELSEDGLKWELKEDSQTEEENAEADKDGGVSTNSDNNDKDGFHYRVPEDYEYQNIPLYDEITYVDLSGQEQIKVVTNATKENYPLSAEKRNVSDKDNTYIKAETYFAEVQKLKPGEIYVSDVIGAYIGSNYIGIYTPSNVEAAAQERGYDIPYDPEEQSYAGQENPNGQRFEGIVRWATPIADENGNIKGYLTFALNHDHIMEFVDHITPTNERYTQVPSAYEGNYAFIWDYKCRNICHPRHNSIVGYDPETGDPQIPWLETSIYEEWKASGVEKWTDFVQDYPTFDDQSREKKPDAELTRQGLVGLDGRYLNNAPQCTGWMDLTKDGGSGSFYILWSGLYKLTTAGAIPYYTGQYAPSEANDHSRRGFGIVTIGAGLEDFTRPAAETEITLVAETRTNLLQTAWKLGSTAIVLIILVVLIAIWIASSITGRITGLIGGISRFRSGERQFRFNSQSKDEFGTLADSFDEMADSIVDSVKHPLSITDMDLRIIYVNEEGLKLNHKVLEGVVGKLYSENSIYAFGSEYCPITALKKGREPEVYYIEEEDEYVKGVANYFLNSEGEKIGYIIETLDMTDMVHTQIKLEEAVSYANQANEHKGEFLARMSHEIRTPMNAIMGVTNIVTRKLEQNEQPNVPEIQDHIGQIENSSQHLLGLLNDILDISKIEAGKIELVEETIYLSKLVDTVIGMINPRCEEKNITFNTSFDVTTKNAFLIDSLRLRQVLINLLGNAVKFTPECGWITFTVTEKDHSDGRTLFRFSVKDNGIGIKEEAIGNIFAAFEQGNKDTSSNYGGTGLGLAISQRIVQLFGGHIEVTSMVGEGSEFVFEIWMVETQADLPEQQDITNVKDQFKGKRALVVDDVDINRMIVASLLEETGIVIDEAQDGLEAVEQFEKSEPGTYDIILMDVQMPNMDGYEAARTIRALEREDAHSIPIVALTANAFKEDITKAAQEGMNGHIAKPIETEMLYEVLFRFIG